MTAQGQFSFIKVGEGFKFAEVVPRNGAKPVLHFADHRQVGRVTFNLDGKRFRHQGFRLILMGSSGSGKSYAMGVIAEEVHRAGLPFLLFDQESEFGGLAELPGIEAIEAHENTDVESAVDFVLVQGGALVLDVGEMGLEAQRYFFYRVAQQFYQVAGTVKRRCFLFVDEAAELAPQRRLRGSAESREWMERFARRGRKKGINWVLATQRPGDLSKSVYAQANVKLIGRIEIINDYDAIRPYLTRRIPMAELSRLDTGDFLLDLAGTSEVVRVRQRRTEDWGWTPTQ